MTITEIDPENLRNYLNMRFSDRIHAQSKQVLQIRDELSKDNIKNIEDLDVLVKKYPPDEYLSKMEHETGSRLADVGVIRSLLVARKIDEINNIIDNWGPLPVKPETLIDTDPFVNIGGGIASYLMKSGDSIKIHTTNIGTLEISFDELGDRIGTGLPYLRRLVARLESFKEILFPMAESETQSFSKLK
ncbi:MAG TPA: hypothetical protein HA349_07000 [Methanotrichaceae archaeon]|nr:hypothetical protein [Methanotrichaceae archaeon]